MTPATPFCTAFALVGLGSTAGVQAQNQTANFPVGFDPASGLQPTGGVATAFVLPAENLPVRGVDLTEGFDDITTLVPAGWASLT